MLHLKQSVLLFFILSLLISSAPASEEERVELRLWNVPPARVMSPYQKAERAVFEHFVKAHPELAVTMASGIRVEGPAKESAFLMAMAGGTAPDVINVYFRQAQAFIEQGFLYPLDEYIKDWPDFDKVPEYFWPTVTGKGKDGKEHIYAIPWRRGFLGLYYRRDLFQAAGLDPDRPPKDWDEFYEFAKRLTIPEASQWGYGISLGGSGWHFANWVWQAGGEMVEQGPDGKWRAVFNGEGGVRALDFYKKLRWDKWQRSGKEYEGVVRIVQTNTDLLEDFSSGRIAMSIGYSDFHAGGLEKGLVPSQIGMASLPAGPTGIKANFIDPEALAINSTIRDKKKTDAAWEYIKYILSDDSHRVRTKVLVETGWHLFAEPEDLRKFGYEDYLRKMPESWVKGHEEIIKYGRVEPSCPNYQNVQTTELRIPIGKALLEGRDSKEVLDKAAHRVNEYIFGTLPKEVMTYRRKLGYIIGAIVLLVVGFLFFKTFKSLSEAYATSGGRVGAKAVKRRMMHHLGAWLFMLPAVATLLVFAYFPLARGSGMALYDYRLLGGSKFISIDNFVSACGSPVFWTAVKNTFFYVFLSLVLGFFAPIILALFLAEVPKGKMLFRTLFFLPMTTSALVIMFLWKKIMFDPAPSGALNTILSVFGLGPYTWLNSPALALLCIIIPGIWGSAGPGSIIYLAALKSVPEELYEAADVDGAGVLRKVFSVTLPTLKPLIIINFVGAFIVCQNPKMWTLMVYLYEFQQEAPTFLVMAALVIAAIPTLLVFIFCQNIIMRGIIIPLYK